MDKNEKILKKIGKLLSIYGVNEEEKAKFLADVQDTKYDDQEEIEEADESPTEEKEEVEESEVKEEESAPAVEEEKEPVADEEPKPEQVEQPIEEKVEEEPVEESPVVEQPQEEVANDSEKLVDDEQPLENESAEQETVFDAKSSFEEMQKTFDGITARISSLEDIVSKLSVPAQDDQTIGASASGNAVNESSNDAFEEINRKRVG